jgi:hypothetical protein
MASFNQRLQREIARRNSALAGLAQCGSTSAAIVSHTLEQTKLSIRAEIQHVDDCVSGQIRSAGNLVRQNIEQTGATLSSQIDGLKASLSPAKIINDHPWGATLAAAIAGAVVVPLLKAQFNRPHQDQLAIKPPPINGNCAELNSQHGSPWTPVVNVVLESLPVLLAAYMNRSDARTERP